MENSETKSPINVLESRIRIDERALEKEEEDYFKEDRWVFTTMPIVSLPSNILVGN